MKGLSIKKLAAIATGAVLVGTALAPIVSAIDITRSDIYDATTGRPVVNIVVGSEAQVSDAVWAANIAAAIAEKAYTTGSCTATASGSCTGDAAATVSDLTVDIAVGGTTTYEAAKTYKNTDLNSATSTNDSNHEFFGKVLNDSTLTHLVNKSYTIKWDGTNYSRTFKEEIGLDADAKFDAVRPAVQDLVVYMELEGDFNYTINLGDGIPRYDTSSALAKFTDGSNDNVKIPFFGQDYLVSTVDKGTDDINGHYVKMMKSSDIQRYNEGDVITGLTGKNTYAGQDMSVKVVEVIQAGTAVTTYSATFELYDAEGTLVDTRTIAAGEYLNESFVDSSDNYALSSTLYADRVAVASTTNVGYVDILKGTSVVELYHGKGYPYDSSDAGPYPWKVSMVTSGNYVTSISIMNSSKLWNDTNPVYARIGALTTAGQSGASEVGFLEGQPADTDGKDYAKVLFDGLEQDEALTTITVGEKVNVAGYEVPTIKYKDSTDSAHTIPLYIQLPATTTGSTFTFDGKTLYYAVNKGDNDADSNATSGMVDVNIADQETINGNIVDLNFMQVFGADTRDTNVMINNYGLIGGNLVDGNGVDPGTIADLNGVAYQVKDTNACGSFNTTAPGCASGDYNNVTLSFDGNVTFRKLSSTGDLYTTTAGTFQTTSTSLTTTWYYDDLNLLGTLGPAYFTNPVWLEGANDKQYKYAMAVSETYNKIWLLLDRSTAFDVQYNKDIQFAGTDRFEGGIVTSAVVAAVKNIVGSTKIYPMAVGSGADANGMTYFYPDELEFGASSSDNSFMVATLTLETDDEDSATYDANIYLDTRFSDGDAITLPNNNLSVYTSDLNSNGGSTDPRGINVTFAMDEDPLTTTQPAKGYNDFGAKYTLSSGIVTASIPENITRPILVVKSTTTTTTTTDAENLLAIAEGSSGTTAGGTTITVSKVNYSASCTAGTGEVTCTASPSTYTTNAPVPNPIVYLDTSAPAGPNIIVGGPIVSTVAAAVAGLADRLVAPGDVVAEVDATTGDIIIAGYTANDTGVAAQELIDAIDALS